MTAYITAPLTSEDPLPGRVVDFGDGTFARASVPIDDAGNPLSSIGGGAITVADGSDHTEGATTDAAVVTNAVGTLSAKLRGLVALARKGAASAPATVTVDSTATGIVLLASNANRLEARIQNLGVDPVYIGKDTSVTASNGFRIAGGETFVDERTAGAWRGICASGKTADCRVLEVS